MKCQKIICLNMGINLNAQIDTIESKRGIRPTLIFKMSLRGNNNCTLKFGEIQLDIKHPDSDKSATLCKNAVYLNVELNRKRSANQDFDIQLNDSDLDKIENIRGGGDLRFVLTGNFHAHNNRGGEFDTGNFVLKDRIPQSDWAEILSTFDYGDIQVIELRFPDSPAKEHFEKAWTHVEDADRQFTRGNWSETLTHCRKAVDVIDRLDSVENIGELVGSEKWDRMGTLKGNLSHYLSLGAKSDEKTRHEPILRRDAQASLLMTKAMVNYLGDVFRDRED